MLPKTNRPPRQSMEVDFWSKPFKTVDVRMEGGLLDGELVPMLSVEGSMPWQYVWFVDDTTAAIYRPSAGRVYRFYGLVPVASLHDLKPPKEK